MEEEIIYVVFKDSNMYGVYDEEKWKDFNEHYDAYLNESKVINRFTVHKAIINGRCTKIYLNRYTHKWEEDT